MTFPPDANPKRPTPPKDESTPVVQDEIEAAGLLWQALCEGLEKRFSLFVFRGFIRPLMPVRLDDGLFTLAAPSPFHRDWVRDHYAAVLEEETRALVGALVRVSVVHDPRIPMPEALDAPPAGVMPEEPPSCDPTRASSAPEMPAARSQN